MTKHNGAILWRGASELDGQPIVVIATGLGKSSRNSKTGDLIQTWILREDVSPTDAVNSGADKSICGSCIHRGTIENGKNVGRSCYVTIFQAPLNVWKSYRRGIYPQATNETLAGRRVRLGSYGDPASVPVDVWKALLADSLSGTGYTHQWRDCPTAFSQWVMASCDDQEDSFDAAVLGYRTFRVTALDSRRDKQAGEVVCPASEEAGKKTNCAACLACGGTNAKARANIVISVHGAAGKVNAAKARINA
jgi:hypothetical protein